MMMIKAVFALLFTLPLALAWNHHHVVVGPDSKLVYDPPYLNADVGDKVTFSFRQKNHTVTQSSFPSPCSPLLAPDHATHIGFSSGFQPVGPAVTSNFPTVTLTVLTTDPIWIYCQQTGHCQQGMVFAVNPPPSGNTFDKFKAAAIASGASTGGSHARAEPRRYPRAALVPNDQ